MKTKNIVPTGTSLFKDKKILSPLEMIRRINDQQSLQSKKGSGSADRQSKKE
ncbi:MAG: hypothetical protein ABI288_09885 [Ginsengibacter sp.]